MLNLIIKKGYLFRDSIVESFGTVRDFDVVWKVEVFHVVRAVSFFFDVSIAGGSESFNCVGFSFLHFDVGVVLDARNCFSSMNFVRINGVAIQVLDYFDLMGFSFDLDFITLHGFLYESSDFSKSGIDSCISDSSVGSIFDSFE